MTHGRWLSLLRSLGTGLCGTALLVGVWWLVASGTTSAEFPGPAETINTIFGTFYQIKQLRYIYYSSGGLAGNLAYTIANVVSSVAIGSIVGVLFGVFVSRSTSIATV